jgi:hypothetical protein
MNKFEIVPSAVQDEHDPKDWTYKEIFGSTKKTLPDVYDPFDVFENADKFIWYNQREEDDTRMGCTQYCTTHANNLQNVIKGEDQNDPRPIWLGRVERKPIIKTSGDWLVNGPNESLALGHILGYLTC